ncbi:MAG: c-type cytochrome [Planctomycetota bacterium]
MPQLFTSITTLTLVVLTLFVSGCSEPHPIVFEPNLVHAMKYQIREEVPMEQASEDAFWVVSEMFGTPDAPTLPTIILEDEELATVVSMDRLLAASGPADIPGRGLYRKHCVSCHGVTGDGRGLTAALLNPYPRDYRKGVFKFKSTRRGAKPTREDLHGLIKNGIPGSAMVAIPELTDEDTDALVDYVIYLSWRGELERTLMDDAIFELDLEDGDRIINPAGLQSKDEETKELFEESWELAEDYAIEIAEAWLEAEDEFVPVPAPPAEIPVPDSYAQYLQMSAGENADALAASVQRGGELFVGKIASCGKCHGNQGLGDGQTTDYDDWTKDWTSGAGLKPEDRESLVPLLARGAMTPINAKPRNFRLGVFHGGADAASLYRRITIGIEGSPMPAVTYVSGEFERDDVWHLINFIRSLKSDEPVGPSDSAEAPAAADLATAGI